VTRVYKTLSNESIRKVKAENKVKVKRKDEVKAEVERK
jgi:hypothetical protein